MFGFLKKLFGTAPDYKELLNQGALIVDVRTGGEFKSGHIKHSINIPIEIMGSMVSELKQKGKPVITCCASGMRSARAVSVLRRHGVEAYNGGSWVSLSNKL